jgi:hypothetical protein
MKTALLSFWQFLKYPRLLRISSTKKDLKNDLLALLLLNFLFYGLIIGIWYVLVSLKLIREYESIDLFDMGFLVTLLLGAVAAPVIEECIFRWQLRKIKLSIYFVMVSLMFSMLWFTENDKVLFFGALSLLVFAILFHLVMSRLRGKRASIAWRRYYVFLFYFTAIIFGLVHMSNTKDLTFAEPSFPLYVSSQIFGGLALGYIRLKYGLPYSMLFHSIFNLIAVPIAWFMR